MGPRWSFSIPSLSVFEPEILGICFLACMLGIAHMRPRFSTGPVRLPLWCQ